MVKRILNPNSSSSSQNARMSDKERFLFASCLDNLWRLVVLAQENSLSKELMSNNFDVYSSKNTTLQGQNICQTCEPNEARQTIYMPRHDVENSKEYLEIKKKLDHALEEKERFCIIANERLFDLKCYDKDANIQSIKNNFKELEKNMHLILKEK